MPHNVTRRILFVSNRRADVSLRRLLNATRRFAVTFEKSSREGFDQLTRSSFEVVVIDLDSTVDACEFIKRIRKVATFRATPIVVVGEWGTGQPSLALSAGADVFEPAPVDAARLIEAITRLPKRLAAAAGKGY
jgi:DNA-binding NarL/FixJ family response regulator